MGHSLLKGLFLANQSLHLLKGVLPGEVFQDYKSLPQIFILILKLENLSILVIDQLGLLLDGFSESEVPLQNLLHHVHRVDDSASNCVLRLICSIVAQATLCDHCAGRAYSVCVYAVDFIS